MTTRIHQEDATTSPLVTGPAIDKVFLLVEDAEVKTWVVAKSREHAIEQAAEFFIPNEETTEFEVTQVPDDELITITGHPDDFDGSAIPQNAVVRTMTPTKLQVVATAAEWASVQTGILCSSEW